MNTSCLCYLEILTQVFYATLHCATQNLNNLIPHNIIKIILLSLLSYFEKCLKLIGMFYDQRFVVSKLIILMFAHYFDGFL